MDSYDVGDGVLYNGQPYTFRGFLELGTESSIPKCVIVDDKGIIRYVNLEEISKDESVSDIQN